MDGFTIILSKTNNYINYDGDGENMGYFKIYDALVSEIDLYQNSYDSSSDTASLHMCHKTYCTSQEGSNTIQRNLPFKYDKCKVMIYDVLLQIKGAKYYLFVNDALIIEAEDNLLDQFDGFTYLGFTGFFRGNQRELKIEQGSYFCQDEIKGVDFYSINNGITFRNSQLPPEIPAGSAVEVTVRFKDVEGLIVPHFNDMHVIDWKLTIGYNCNTEVYNWKPFNYIDKLNIQNIIYDCNKVGIFEVFFDINGQKLPSYFSKVVGRGYELLTIIGENSQILDKMKISRIENNSFYLNFGPLGGDFLTDQAILKIDLFPSDIFGNIFDLGTDPIKILQTSQIQISRNGNLLNFSLAKKSNGNYELSFPIQAPGEYKIENIKFLNSKPFIARVLPGNIDLQKSSCQITNDLSTALDNNTKVTYVCSLFDKYGNTVDIPSLEKFGSLQKFCILEKSSNLPTYTKLSDLTPVILNNNSYSCEFITLGNGFYRINSSFIMGNPLFYNYNVNITLKPIINEFRVISTPNNLNKSKFYDPTTQIFKTCETEDKNLIKYSGSGDYPLTLISLADESGAESADIGYGYKFSLSDFSGVFYNFHTESTEVKSILKFQFFVLPLTGKKYISVSLENQQGLIKKNDFYYVLKVTYKTSSISFRLVYPVIQSYGQVVCNHDLDIKKTMWTPTKDASNVLKNSTPSILGQLILRTTDNNLFYSTIPQIRLKYTITPAIDTTTVSFVEDRIVSGYYSVVVNGKIANNYSLNILIDNITILNGYIFIISSTPIASTLTSSPKNNFSSAEINPTYGQRLIDTDADSVTNIFLTAFDIYNNFLNYSPVQENNFLGLNIEISVNNVKIVENINSEKISFVFNQVQQAYLIQDLMKLPGNYLIKIIASNGNKLTYNFNKKPGLVFNSNSFAVLNSANKIRLSEQIIVSLTLKDKSNNNISFDPDLLNKELTKIKISALHEDNKTKLDLIKSENSSGNPLYILSSLPKVGKYKIIVSYTNQAIISDINCNNCLIDANYEQFDINMCKLYIVTSKNILITTGSITNINNVNDIPLFNFLFFDAAGNQLNYVDNTTNFKAFITGPNIRLDLNTEWVKSYQILWTMPESNVSEDKKFKNLKGDNYMLNISLNEKTVLTYTLKLLGDITDTGSGNGVADISKTFINEPIINAIAGISYNTNIIFRTVENLRVNFYEELFNFTFKNSLNLDSKKFNIIPQKGPTKGSYILSIYSEVSALPSNPIIITIFFRGLEIPDKIKFNVKNSELSFLDLNSKYIKSLTDFTLKDGLVIDEYLIDFVAYDKFSNIFLDIYDPNIYSTNRIKSLFNVEHSELFQITLNSVTSVNKDKFTLGITSRNIGIVTINTTFMKNSWKIKFYAGKFNKEKSFGKVDLGKINAGNTVNFFIFPRDEYNNIIELGKILDTDLQAIKLNLYSSTLQKTEIIKKLNPSDNSFIFTTQIKTKGNSIFKPVFYEEDVRCLSCQVMVTPTPYIYEKSKLFYTAGVLPILLTDNYELTKSNLPIFGLNLYDSFENIYDQIPLDFNIKAVLKRSDGQILLEFCTTKNNNNINIFICIDLKSRRNWEFLLSGNYLLVIEQLNSTNTNKFLNYSLKINDGIVDPNASNAEVDISKTIFGKIELITTAGDSGTFTLQIQTIDGKRKFSFEEEPEKYIILSFSKNILNNYKVSVNLGQLPGIYLISVISNKTFSKADNNMISFTINNILLSNKIQLITKPQVAKYGIFVDLITDEKLTAFKLGNADESYELKLKIFDKFDNLIETKMQDVNLNILPPSDKELISIISNVIINPDFSVRISINTIFKGIYTIKSGLFSDITFEIMHGLPTSNNSLALVEPVTKAGTEVKLYIIPFDKNNNYVKAESINLKSSDLSFHASYKFKQNGDFTLYNNLADPKLELIEYPKGSKIMLNSLSFSIILQYQGPNYFRATLGVNEIKCVNCVSNVLPSEPLFNHFLFQFFDSVKGSFSELAENTVFDNVKSEPIIRIIPRDKFLNIIPLISDFTLYNLSFTEKKNVQNIYKFKIHFEDDKKQQLIEYIQNDNSIINKDLSFKTLTKGVYILNISQNAIIKSFNVNLLGTDSDSDASNDPLDITKTIITDSALEFEADLTGRLIIELRTTTNLRKNNWFYKVSVEPRVNDPSFRVTITNATKLGQYLVIFGSTLANTFPKPFEYGLKIMVDGKEVLGLNPLLKINPGNMAKSYIVDSYLKSIGSLEILDGNSDKNLFFNIQAKDKFNNIAKVNVDLLKLSITGPDGNIVINTPDIQQYSESLGFTVETKLSGIYSLIGNTLQNYKYSSLYGEINFENTLVYNTNNKLVAGKNAMISIIPKDKNNNLIDTNKIVGIFKVSCKTPKGNILIGQGIAEVNKITFNVILTEKGISKWSILLKDTPKICDSCITEVIPDIPALEKSLTFIKDDPTKTSYLNNSELKISNKNFIGISISLRDKYENLINQIPENCSINSPIFGRNDIEPINLDISLSIDNSQILIKIPENKQELFKHLITGNNYFLKYTLKNSANTLSTAFSYIINLSSDRNDIGYGNGKYLVSNTYISNSQLNLYADKTSTFSMRLKTKENLLYNNDIDLDKDLTFIISPSDLTFTLKAEKNFEKYNDFTITVYSKTSLLDSKLKLSLSLRDPENVNNFIKIPQEIYLSVKPKMPPFPKNTKILSRPTAEYLEPKQIFFITFNLSDEYGNLYNNNKDVLKYLKLFNNNKEVLKDFVIQLRNDGTTYEASFTPDYPPKYISFEVFYFDLEENIKTNIINEIISKKIVSIPDLKYTKISGENINIMKAGEKLNMYVMFYDKYNICVDLDNEIPIVAKAKGPIVIFDSDSSTQNTYTYNFKKIISSGINDQCKTKYIVEVPEKTEYTRVGEYELSVLVGPQLYKLEPIIQKLISSDIDPSKTKCKFTDENVNSSKIIAGSDIDFVLFGFDKFNNPIHSSLKDFKIKLKNRNSDLITENTDYSLRIVDEKLGELNVFSNIKKSGLYHIEYFYNDILVNIDTSKGLSDFAVLPTSCNKKYPSIDTKSLDKAITGEPTFILIYCFDEFNNKISAGGEIFENRIQIKTKSGKSIEINGKLIDNKDGSYKIQFTPPLTGQYDIKIILKEEDFININNKEIKENNCVDETMFKCTNIDKCVKNLKECNTDNEGLDCPNNLPFGCKINGTAKCVESKTLCDCPLNHMKCPSSNTCIRKEKFDSMCFDPLEIDCENKYPDFPVFNNDGICRFKKENPSQRVCPLGYTLCPDLTCRKSLSECDIYEDCKNDEIRCIDMSCVKDQKDCPSTITCQMDNQFVCPDGSCVLSELNCKRLPQCNGNFQYLCAQNVCSDNKMNCPKAISCGHGKSLCSDVICRNTCQS